MAANPMASRSAALAGAAQAMNKPKVPGGDFRQNLAGATGGTIKGANGGTQQLGPNAMKRIAASGPPPGTPSMPAPQVRTPPIMDPSQKPSLPGFGASPGMTPYMPPGGAGSGSVAPGTPGDAAAKLSQFGAGGMSAAQPGPGIVPNLPGAPPDINGSSSADPSASLISRLNNGMMQTNAAGQPPETFQAKPLPGFASPPGGEPFGGSDPGFSTLPAMANVHPGSPGGSPGMMGGAMPPPAPFGKEPMPAPAPGGQFGPAGVRPPMNTKPLPGLPAPGPGDIWGKIAGGASGGGAAGPKAPRNQMASY